MARPRLTGRRAKFRFQVAGLQVQASGGGPKPTSTQQLAPAARPCERAARQPRRPSPATQHKEARKSGRDRNKCSGSGGGGAKQLRRWPACASATHTHLRALAQTHAQVPGAALEHARTDARTGRRGTRTTGPLPGCVHAGRMRKLACAAQLASSLACPAHRRRRRAPPQCCEIIPLHLERRSDNVTLLRPTQYCPVSPPTHPPTHPPNHPNQQPNTSAPSEPGRGTRQAPEPRGAPGEWAALDSWAPADPATKIKGVGGPVARQVLGSASRQAPGLRRINDTDTNGPEWRSKNGFSL